MVLYVNFVSLGDSYDFVALFMEAKVFEGWVG